ncbi:hypothetical protein, partial [Klebsiella grimontii]|uniref:hypothetical protein n=1 Tax=Klebsiella grimontii TaxID=2058152 RepID=UPI001C497F95
RPNSKSLLNEQAFLRLSPVQVPSTASGKFSCSALCSRGRRLTRLARATGSPLSAGRSRGEAYSTASGKMRST